MLMGSVCPIFGVKISISQFVVRLSEYHEALLHFCDTTTRSTLTIHHLIHLHNGSLFFYKIDTKKGASKCWLLNTVTYYCFIIL